MKKFSAMMAAILLCLSVCGCNQDAASTPQQSSGQDNTSAVTEGSTSSEAVTSSSDSTAPDTPVVKPEEKPDFAKKAEGLYHFGSEGFEVWAMVDCLGGKMFVEYANVSDGSVDYFLVQEINPDDSAALFDDSAVSFTGTAKPFGYFDRMPEYFAAYDVIVSLTDDGISFTYGNYTDSFDRVEDEGYMHTFPEVLYNMLSEQYTLTSDSEITGSWYYSDSDMDVFLELNPDNSLTFALKAEGTPIEFHVGAWGIDPDGNIRILTERVGEGALAQPDYAFSYISDGGKLMIESASEGSLIPKPLELSAAPYDRCFADGLFAERNDILSDSLFYELIGYKFAEDKEITSAGESVELCGEKCEIFYLGDMEYTFAVSPTFAIYQYTDSWESFNTLADIYINSEPDALFAVLYDNNAPQYQYIYQNCASGTYWDFGEDIAVVLPLRSDIDIRLERVSVDYDTGIISAGEICGRVENAQRRQAIEAGVNIAESIPEYRIVAEYNGMTAVWYAAYDGNAENGIAYAVGYSE